MRIRSWQGNPLHLLLLSLRPVMAGPQYTTSYTVAFLSPDPVTMYLSSGETSQLSTDEDSLDWEPGRKQGHAARRERRRYDDGWMDGDRWRGRGRERERLEKDMSHHLILSHSRHICISKQFAIIFKQTTARLQDADSFICFSVKQAALYLLFSPLSVSLWRQAASLTAGLSITGSTLLMAAQLPFFSGTCLQDQTWTPGYRGSEVSHYSLSLSFFYSAISHS